MTLTISFSKLNTEWNSSTWLSAVPSLCPALGSTFLSVSASFKSLWLGKNSFHFVLNVISIFKEYKIDRSDSDSVDTRVANRRTLSKKSKQYLRDNYSANGEEEEGDALTDFDMFNMYEIQSKQKEFALIYNKSLGLKKRNPNKLISIRNNRQMDLNNLLN